MPTTELGPVEISDLAAGDEVTCVLGESVTVGRVLQVGVGLLGTPVAWVAPNGFYIGQKILAPYTVVRTKAAAS